MGTRHRHNGAEPPSERRRSGGEGQLERDAKELITAIERLSDDAGRSLRNTVDRRPYASLGLGFLGGYVLGGGLTVRLGSLIVGAAWRAALANLVARGIPRGKVTE